MLRKPKKTTKTFRKTRRKLEKTRLFPSLLGACATIRGHGSPLRMACISDGQVYTSEQQFAPVFRHALDLAARFGIVPEKRSWREVLNDPQNGLTGIDILAVMFSFDTPRADILQIIDDILIPARQDGTAIILFDGDDDCSVLWPECLEISDLCVKKHAFRDRGTYQRKLTGKSNLTDYTARQFGISFAQDRIPTSGGLSAQNIAKIRVGWNIGLDDKILDMSRDFRPADHDRKDVDLLCRAWGDKSAWIHPMRLSAITVVENLGEDFRVLAPKAKVSQAVYDDELFRSRACVSPFGYGELCWRDFESVLAGALLVKPDMRHIETAPDIFIAGETYIPVSWDYSDLREAVTPYLMDERKRRRIVDQAYTRLTDAFGKEWFLSRFDSVVLQALRQSHPHMFRS